jgi:hypothetical protein
MTIHKVAINKLVWFDNLTVVPNTLSWISGLGGNSITINSMAIANTLS